MVVHGDSAAVYGHKLSSVVPGSVTGDNVVYQLSEMDLATKLHYLRGVYYFRSSNIVDGLNIVTLKEPMFPWLNVYYPVAGRVRWTEAGRPLIKCNDSGVRIVEAQCNWTLDECLEAKDPSWKQLASDKVLRPDIRFSPLVYVQFTRFKCGGMAIGFSWSHVLGDSISATNSINLWAQLLSGSMPPKSHHLSNPQNETEKSAEKLPGSMKPLAVKQIESVGDCWVVPNNSKLATDSFQISETKLKHLQSEETNQLTAFDIISALIWKCLAKIREGRELKLVTICRNDPSAKRSSILSNEQKISSVMTDCSPNKLELSELGMLIAKQEVDETKAIEELVDKDNGIPDVVVYGANLTFVDMEGIDLYGLELKGQKPAHVDYGIDGVGEEGAVLVSQGPKKPEDSDGNRGRRVTIILPENQISQLRELLMNEWNIA